MKAAVIDASVAAKWVMDEEHSDRAALLFDCDALHAPAHWRAEAVNALWSKVANKSMKLEAAQEKLAVLLQSTMVETAIAGLMAEAFENATDFSITVYDALYVTLAARLRLPLVTADQRLIRKLEARSGIDVRWIGSLTI